MQKKVRFFKTLVYAAAFSLLCAGAVLATETSSQTDKHGNPLTEKQIQQLEKVKVATSIYHNVKKAEKDGFKPVGGCVQVPELGGTMGIHYFNSSRIDNNLSNTDSLDDVLTPVEPELLLYVPGDDGKLKLAGVEYMVSETEWKTIHSKKFSKLDDEKARAKMMDPDGLKPSIFGFEFEGLMEPHGPGEPWHFDKHIWLYSENPSGIDAQWNPDIDCK